MALPVCRGKYCPRAQGFCVATLKHGVLATGRVFQTLLGLFRGFQRAPSPRCSVHNPKGSAAHWQLLPSGNLLCRN